MADKRWMSGSAIHSASIGGRSWGRKGKSRTFSLVWCAQHVPLKQLLNTNQIPAPPSTLQNFFSMPQKKGFEVLSFVHLFIMHSCSLFSLFVIGTQLPFKNRLQIYCQKRRKHLPSYRPIQEGMPHSL
jgi:hypothetical protein